MDASDTPLEYKAGYDPLLSPKQAAEYLGMKLATFYKYAKEHEIPRVRITADSKIRKSVLDELIRQNEQPWRWGKASLQINGEETP
jgi:excisionase family DNA binding protein